MASPPEIQDFYHQFGLWTSERIGSLSAKAAHLWGDREFLRVEDRRFSFSEFDRWVVKTAQCLIAEGVKPGDRIYLQLNNCPEVLVLQLAAWRIGAISVPIVPIYRSHEIKAILADIQPAVVAMSATARSPHLLGEVDDILSAADWRPRIKISIDQKLRDGWRSMPAEPRPDESVSDAGLPPPGAADACCMILFTSGTTSAPKGARVTSRGLISSIGTFRSLLGLGVSDVAFSGAPLAHIGGIFNTFLVPLAIGGRSVVLNGWDADRAIEVIQEERATYMAGASVFLHDLLERYEHGQAFDHRLKLFIAGGAPTAPALVERADKVGIRAIRVYGMTEVVGVVTLANGDTPLEQRATTDGKVAFGADVEIVDDERRPVSFGELGSIRLRTPQLFLGYTDPTATADQLDANGWFYPGDLGVMTADGWLTIVGRTKDIINRGGEKFSSQDIEAALVSCLPIRTAAVVGVPHPRLGEVVAAFVTLREGARWDGPDVVLDQLEKLQLARQKFPVEWHVIETLPTTASGKVQKQKLLEMAAAKEHERTAKAGPEQSVPRAEAV